MLHDLDLYKEYYEGSNRADAQWTLILSDDPTEIKRLEALLKMTQADAVDDYIETSCWNDDLPDFAGNKGTPGERLNALRDAYLKQLSDKPGLTDYGVLTPLEHNLFMLVWDMEQACTDPALKKRAKFALESAKRIADRAKPHQMKEYGAMISREARKRLIKSNVEMLAEQLGALDSLKAAGITIKISDAPGKARIYFNLPFGHTTAYFEFAEVLPYDASGAPGTVSDLCKGNAIQVFSDLQRLTRPQGKRISSDLYTYLYLIFCDAAREGKIKSPVMAGTKFPPDVLRKRAADLKRIAGEFAGSHEAFLKSLDPVHGRDSREPPFFPAEGAIDATAAKTLDEFIDKFVAKDSPEIAGALRQAQAVQNKKKALGKRSKK